MKQFFAFLIVWAALSPTPQAEGQAVTTTNFIVDASTNELAREVAKQAEAHRRDISIHWVGRELPTWEPPCLLFVSVEDKPWAWTYHYKGEIRGITIRGQREDIFNHSLPHEITHAIIWSYFGDEVPRWADEGMAVFSELDCPHRLNGRWGTQPLSQLFTAQQYPIDWELFYGQGFSVTAYLVETYGKFKFLEFIRQGMQYEWEKACNLTLKTTLSDLENDWQLWHNNTFESVSSIAGNEGLRLRGDGPCKRRWDNLAGTNHPHSQSDGGHRVESVHQTVRRVARNP